VFQSSRHTVTADRRMLPLFPVGERYLDLPLETNTTLDAAVILAIECQQFSSYLMVKRHEAITMRLIPTSNHERRRSGTYKTCALSQPDHQFLQSPNHLSQFAQTRSVSLVTGEPGVLKSVFASACRSRICNARPSLAWKAAQHSVNTWPANLTHDT